MSSTLDAARGLGLEEDLPLPAEAVELVDVDAAEEGLERLVDVSDRDALFQHLVPVDVGEDLGHGGRQTLLTLASSGRLARPPGTSGGSCRGTRRFRRSGPGARSEKPPPVPRPWIAGGGKAKTFASGILARNSLLTPRMIGPTALLALALVPRLERDEVESGVGRRGAGQEAVAGDRLEVLDALGLGQDLLDLLAHRVGALERRGVGELDVDEEVTLVLVRQEARRAASCRAARRADEADQEREGEDDPADQEVREPHVAVGHLAKTRLNQRRTARAAPSIPSWASASGSRAPATASAR